MLSEAYFVGGQEFTAKRKFLCSQLLNYLEWLQKKLELDLIVPFPNQSVLTL